MQKKRRLRADGAGVRRLFSVNGYPDRPGVRIGTSVLDLGTGCGQHSAA